MGKIRADIGIFIRFNANSKNIAFDIRILENEKNILVGLNQSITPFKVLFDFNELHVQDVFHDNIVNVRYSFEVEVKIICVVCNSVFVVNLV